MQIAYFDFTAMAVLQQTPALYRRGTIEGTAEVFLGNGC